MRSSVYINETGPEAVSLDFSVSPSELVYKDLGYGFPFQKTLEHLGLTAEPGTDPELYDQLVVEGTVDTIKEHVHELGHHIGLIARYGAKRTQPIEAFQNDERRWIAKTLSRFILHTIPELPENASLMRTMGLIVEPFAEAASSDGTLIYYGRYPGSGTDRNVVRAAEDGTPLGPFSARDIGGLLIGPGGLPAREGFDMSFWLPEGDTAQLNLIGAAKQTYRGSKLANYTYLGSELRQSLRKFLDSDGQPEIDGDTPEEVCNFRLGVPRTDLEQLYSRDFGRNITFGEVMRTAVKNYLAEHEEDVELQTAVEEEIARRRSIYAYDEM